MTNLDPVDPPPIRAASEHPTGWLRQGSSLAMPIPASPGLHGGGEAEGAASDGLGEKDSGWVSKV